MILTPQQQAIVNAGFASVAQLTAMTTTQLADYERRVLANNPQLNINTNTSTPISPAAPKQTSNAGTSTTQITTAQSNLINTTTGVGSEIKSQPITITTENRTETITGNVVGYSSKGKIALQDEDGEIHWLNADNEQFNQAKEYLTAKAITDVFNGNLSAALKANISKETLHDAGYSYGAIAAAEYANKYADRLQADFEANTVKLDTNEYVSKTAYDNLNVTQQNYLQQNGVQSFNDKYATPKEIVVTPRETDTIRPDYTAYLRQQLDEKGYSKADIERIVQYAPKGTEGAFEDFMSGSILVSKYEKGIVDQIENQYKGKYGLTDVDAKQTGQTATMAAVTTLGKMASKGGGGGSIVGIIPILIAGGYEIADAIVTAQSNARAYKEASGQNIKASTIMIADAETGAVVPLSKVGTINNIRVNPTGLNLSIQTTVPTFNESMPINQSDDVINKETMPAGAGSIPSKPTTTGAPNITVPGYDTGVPEGFEDTPNSGIGSVSWKEPVVLLPGYGRGTPVPKSALDGRATLQTYLDNGWILLSGTATQERGTVTDWDKVMDNILTESTEHRERDRASSKSGRDVGNYKMSDEYIYSRAYLEGLKKGNTFYVLKNKTLRQDLSKYKEAAKSGNSNQVQHILMNLPVHIHKAASDEFQRAYSEALERGLTQTQAEQLARDYAKGFEQSATQTLTKELTQPQEATQPDVKTDEQTTTDTDTATKTDTTTKTTETTRTTTREATRTTDLTRSPARTTTRTRRLNIPEESQKDGSNDKKVAPGYEGSVGWKQGKLHGKPAIRILKPDDTTKVVTGKPPAGVPIISGPGSAKRSIVVLNGNAPQRKRSVDIGAFIAEVTPVGKRKAEIRFVEDPDNKPSSKQNTKSRRNHKFRKPRRKELGGGIVETVYKGKKRRHLKL